MTLDGTQQLDLPQNIDLQELMKPILNLAAAMNIDISTKIDEYLEIMITEINDNMDFRSAAIVIEKTALIYGKKVEYLNQMLENILLNQPQRKTRKRRTEKQLINDFTLQKDFDLSQIQFEDFYEKCEQLQVKKGLQLMNKQIQSLLQARQEMDNQKIEMGPIYNCLVYDDQLMSIVQRQSIYLQQPQNNQQQQQESQQQDQQNDQLQMQDFEQDQQIDINQYQEDNYVQDADLNIEMLDAPEIQDQQQEQNITLPSTNTSKLDMDNFDITMLSQLQHFVEKNLNKITEATDSVRNQFSKYTYRRYKIQNQEHKLETPENGIIYKFQEQDQSFNENNILMRYTTPDKLYTGIQTPIVDNYLQNNDNDVNELLRSQVVKDDQDYDQQQDQQYNYQYDEPQQDLVQVQINQQVTSNSFKYPDISTQSTIPSKSMEEKQTQQRKKISQSLFTDQYKQWIKKLEQLIKKHSEFNVKAVKEQIVNQNQNQEKTLEQICKQTGNSKTRCFVSALFLANEGKLDIKQQDDQILFQIK